MGKLGESSSSTKSEDILRGLASTVDVELLRALLDMTLEEGELMEQVRKKCNSISKIKKNDSEIS